MDGKFNGLFKVHFKGTNKFTSLRAKPKKNSNCLNITCGLILFRGLTLRSIKSAEYFLQITQNGVGHEHSSDSWSTTNFPFFRKSLMSNTLPLCPYLELPVLAAWGPSPSEILLTVLKRLRKIRSLSKADLLEHQQYSENCCCSLNCNYYSTIK